MSHEAGQTGPPHVRAANDAFGQNSPHWNLPFHAGNITAAEILAYFPHWLKSVDVIDRFIMNGGKAKVIAGMLNRFRILPGTTIAANSVCVMMQCAMRAFGVKNWTMGTHSRLDKNRVQAWNSSSLDVLNFRTPHVSHPKKGSKKVENVAAEPIQFRDLAHDVKEHPSGSDALDLTRCVLYAIDHPNESWRFPVDFTRLVNHLGGPCTPTNSHPDTQAFQRHLTNFESTSTRKTLSVTPLVKHVHFDTTNTMVSTRNSNMRLAAPKKRGFDEYNSPQVNTINTNGKRRSGRLATQGFKDLHESDSDAGTPYNSIEASERPQKKRKATRASSTDSEFVGTYTTDSESLPDAKDDASDDYLIPEPKRPMRASARKGRRLTKKTVHNETPKLPHATITSMPTMPALPIAPAVPAVPDYLIDPVLLGYAYDSETRGPVKVPAPTLDYNRLVVDDYSLWLYAEDGCTTRDEMWASALSSQRFNNGPRKHAPFRELHRLTDPLPWDISDWAENIRWAKEQWKLFGIDTWTEYDDHLEQITQWRRQNMWWSENAVNGGGIYHY